jgi:hypothetical protein
MIVKGTLLLAAAASLLWAAGIPPFGACDAVCCADDPVVRGDYVEGRTASVFAGACHAGSEYTTRGREALLAWRIESGTHSGVELAGLRVVAVVAGEANLAETETARASVVYVPADASDAQERALVAWLESRHSAALGAIRRVARAPITFERDGDAFSVAVGEHIALRGRELVDRACCKMPLDVWYEPLARVDGRLVACAERFACDERELARAWSSTGENCAFVATF